jgi:hypothetical protein
MVPSMLETSTCYPEIVDAMNGPYRAEELIARTTQPFGLGS